MDASLAWSGYTGRNFAAYCHYSHQTSCFYFGCYTIRIGGKITNIWIGFGQFLAQIWRVFTSIAVPGTSFSFAQLGFFILFADLTLRLVHRVFDMPYDRVSQDSKSIGRSIGKFRGGEN